MSSAAIAFHTALKRSASVVTDAFVAATTGAGALYWATPFAPWQAALLSFLVCIMRARSAPATW